MRAAFQLDKLDLSRLTKLERDFLEYTNTRPNVGWPTAIVFIVIQTFLEISIYIQRPDTGSQHLMHLTVVGAGYYLALGFWARFWSRLAIFLLLCWHVFWYRNLVSQGGIGIKILFWWPVLTYLFGINLARFRANVIRKTSVRPTPPWERVYTVTGYFDGPLEGIADYCGRPHLYRPLWEDREQDFPDVFELMPIDDGTLELALEDYQIGCRWRAAFGRGEVSGAVPFGTHPALPEDRQRHDELAALLNPLLSFHSPADITARAEFEYPPRDRPLSGALGWVRWTAVDRPAVRTTIEEDAHS